MASSLHAQAAAMRQMSVQLPGRKYGVGVGEVGEELLREQRAVMGMQQRMPDGGVGMPGGQYPTQAGPGAAAYHLLPGSSDAFGIRRGRHMAPS
mmetsp:Transcript_26738/g.64616  ORF Transcript_26738/g.64616 Transcript_26738/m.64616 type:complete len:94 (+) Transcript_26738:2-283(+)